MGRVKGQTMRIPVSFLFGVLAPMPPPVATGPPGMEDVALDQGFEGGKRWERPSGKRLALSEPQKLKLLFWAR